jgi:hypothetical protein
MTAQVGTGSTFVPLLLVFGTLAVPNADGTLLSNMTSGFAGYQMVKGGNVIGMAATLDGTLTTGTLQFTPTVNGTPMTGTFSTGTINIGALANNQTVVSQNVFRFNRGDVVGAIWNKTGTVAPTTRNLQLTLVVLLESYDY